MTTIDRQALRDTYCTGDEPTASNASVAGALHAAAMAEMNAFSSAHPAVRRYEAIYDELSESERKRLPGHPFGLKRWVTNGEYALIGKPGTLGYYNPLSLQFVIAED